jgi:hypothetical protein
MAQTWLSLSKDKMAITLAISHSLVFYEGCDLPLFQMINFSDQMISAKTHIEKHPGQAALQHPQLYHGLAHLPVQN